MNYGLINKQYLLQCTVAVCGCLGNGANNNASQLLMETAGAETNRGLAEDKSDGAGMGITQIDEMPFYDIKRRCRDEDKEAIWNDLNIDINLVEWEHLRYNPLLCMIFTRLKYKKVPEVIPETLVGRAQYDKLHYNSLSGKGTVYHYLKMNDFEMSKYNLEMEIDEASRERVSRKLASIK